MLNATNIQQGTNTCIFARNRDFRGEGVEPLVKTFVHCCWVTRLNFLNFHEFEAEIFLTFARINYLHFTIYIAWHDSSIIL